MDKIIYKCKNCTWKVSIPALWSDLKPTICGNKKCLTSFRKNPEDLVSQLEEAVIEVKSKPEVKYQEHKKQQSQKQSQQQTSKKEETENME